MIDLIGVYFDKPMVVCPSFGNAVIIDVCNLVAGKLNLQTNLMLIDFQFRLRGSCNDAKSLTQTVVIRSDTCVPDTTFFDV